MDKAKSSLKFEWFIDSSGSYKAHDKQQKHFRELCSVLKTKKYCLGENTLILAHGQGKVKLPTVNSTCEIVLE